MTCRYAFTTSTGRVWPLSRARTRRIKCDESQPKCRRCHKSGFQCQYQSVQPIIPGSELVVYTADPLRLRPRDIPDADLRDLRAIDYFRSWTVLEIGGPWSAGLCHNFLLPMLHYEQGIRQAIVALGAFHEGYVDAGGSIHVESDCATRRHGRSQYGAALRSVVMVRGYTQRITIDVALAACILFATIESLRGHVKTSLMHVYSGLRILEEEDSKRSKTEHSPPRRLLRIVLQRLAGQVSEVGPHHFTAELLASFSREAEDDLLSSAIREARALQTQLQHFFQHQVLKLVETSVDRADTADATLANVMRHFKALLEQIKVKYSNLLFSTSQNLKLSYENRALLCFNVMITSLEIIFNIDETTNEMPPDVLVERFREHVCWSQMYLKTFSKTKDVAKVSEKSSERSTNPGEGTTRGMENQDGRLGKGFQEILPKPPTRLAPPLSMNSGVVPSLYMTAARCREPKIRAAAIKLLKTCDRREGPWDSNIAAEIAEKIFKADTK